MESDIKIGVAFRNHFHLLFGIKRGFRYLTDRSSLFIHKPQVVLSALEAFSSLEEIKRVTFNLGAVKAPDPNRFPLSFIQKHWDVIRHDMMCICLDFFTGKLNLERIS